MARALWTGSISFGLVEIAVSMHAAEDTAEEIKFNLLDRRTMKPVGYQRVNKETGKDVPWGEIVRGYEYEKGEYVVLTDDELHRADVEKSESIDIAGFVELAEIEPLFFERPYYLKPLKKGSKGYALLHATLERTGKAGIAKVVLRTRQYVAAMMPRGPALALILLRYADEVRTPESIGITPYDLSELGVSKRELELAEQLVEGMSGAWDPAEYEDEYRKEVLALIERKIRAGKTEEVLVEEKPRKRTGDVLDLMPLLERSLDEPRARGRRAKAAAHESAREPRRSSKGRTRRRA